MGQLPYKVKKPEQSETWALNVAKEVKESKREYISEWQGITKQDYLFTVFSETRGHHLKNRVVG